MTFRLTTLTVLKINYGNLTLIVQVILKNVGQVTCFLILDYLISNIRLDH